MRSKRFEALAKRPVNQDGFVKEWIEEGFIAMESPNDPKPSIKIVNGVVTELDGKPASQFDPVSYTHLTLPTTLSPATASISRAPKKSSRWIR